MKGRWLIWKMCSLFRESIHQSEGRVSSDDDKLKAKPANKINFVDLAGYEDPRKSGRDAITVAESNRKNKLLYALLNVVNAINSNETRVPFQESKLTRILQDSLGGPSHVLLLTCLVWLADHSLQNPCFCQDSLSLISLVSRTCRSVKQVLTDSTNRNQTSAKMKINSSLESGKALSASLSAKKQIDPSRILSVKKASSVVKGRKLFGEVKRIDHNKTQLSCPSEDTSTLKSKILPDLSLDVAPFLLEEEVPQVISNSECSNPTVEPNENKECSNPTVEPNENVNAEERDLKVEDLTLQSSMLLEEVSMHEENNSLNRKDYGSPPLSERIREISNNLISNDRASRVSAAVALQELLRLNTPAFHGEPNLLVAKEWL